MALNSRIQVKPKQLRDEPGLVVSRWNLHQAARMVAAGGLIAYPTESCFGLGCDPLSGDAVAQLLCVKNRSVEKGLILIAADLVQLEPYLLPLSSAVRARVTATWPGPVTWVLPARPEVPSWLRGSHTGLAVRVTAHPIAAALCRATGFALVSTSANRSGGRPGRTSLSVRRLFGTQIDYILPGPVGALPGVTAIRDGITERDIRL